MSHKDLQHVFILIAIRWGGTVGRTIQSAQMKAKDGRILLMNEILQVKNQLKCRPKLVLTLHEYFQGMKVLKLYAWEKPLMGKVIDKIILDVICLK